MPPWIEKLLLPKVFVPFIGVSHVLVSPHESLPPGHFPKPTVPLSLSHVEVDEYDCVRAGSTI